MPQCMNRRYRVTLGVLQLTVDTGGRPHKASITTVQRSCFSKKAIRSLRRTLRLSSAFPASLTPWIWKTDLEVSRPIMLMLILGGSLVAGSNDPQCGTSMPFGGRPPHLSELTCQPEGLAVRE